MKDELVSFETAKLAREKGFIGHCRWYYNDEEEATTFWYYEGDGTGVNSLDLEQDMLPDEFLCLAPTQSLLQRWLREEGWVHISIVKACVGSDEMEYAYEIQYLPKEFWERKRHVQHLVDIESFEIGPGSYDGAWSSYEEALEEALKRALKLI